MTSLLIYSKNVPSPFPSPQLDMTSLKGELSKKDTEIFRLQSQLETLQKQASDRHQHIKVLKETVAAKEQHSASLQV